MAFSCLLGLAGLFPAVTTHTGVACAAVAGTR